MIERIIKNRLEESLTYFPAVALLGPRQVGKTTLVRSVMVNAEQPVRYFDLENPTDHARFQNDRGLLLESLAQETVILDEIHRLPDLFPQLRGLIDQYRKPGRFVLLGSASYDLLKNTSESLAGRIDYMELTPFLLRELPEASVGQHWFRGGFPQSYLAPSDGLQQRWFSSFITTYLEKDLPQLGLTASPALIGRLLTMLGHWQGQLLNYSTLANSLAIASTTVTAYIDFLERALLIRRLQPYYTNVGKRLTKSPKVYVRDSGMLHHLLRIADYPSLLGNPVAGGSWEGYVIEQVLSLLPWQQMPFFYRTADGAELDLVVVSGSTVLVALEIKLSNAPTLSRGTTVALQDLGNPPLLVVTPSSDDYPMRANAWVCSVRTLSENLKRFGVGTD
ncbi:ATP-binding protein [Spirosoma montaniterrae]|uniref:ATPase n=1 Tax=Spirosoma montaniterrae TaxID=1178516 RepID=A0A1P9WTK1_9BACT|nr:ATP-binding protein [Spirosoma montaniterrae]AQG78716.1 ATPase [Spirosoma montaniterrae]